jgi:ubiquinol-cytochrome c reductase cytochrome b subunit
MSSLKQRAIGLYDWFERRLGLGQPALDAAAHPIPKSSASWMYVFGSGATVLFMLQIATGILLALVYSPSAGEAWSSLQLLNHQIPLGWLLRGLHGWGSEFMVAIVLIHMAQVFLFGAYKYPRELSWILGVFLLLFTLGMAFTGQVLRFDQDAYWGLGIGASIVSRVPWAGGPLVHMMLGGPIIGGLTLSRFFALHVFVIPGLLIVFVALHIWMVLHLGVSDWPMPGRVVSKATYDREYHEQNARDGVPFVPDAAWKDAVFSAVILLAVLACALVFGPFGPTGQPDPTIIQTAPKPDYFFLWIYAVLAYLPPEMETPFLFIAPVVAIGAMLLLPLVAGEGERHWSRRPIAVLMVSVIAVSLGVFTHLGTYTPWSPIMDAWSGDPTPAKYLTGRSPLERQGAIVLQNKQCRNCHALGGLGGQRGPALDGIASRMTEDQMIRQVLQGGGNMPAYGNALSPAETRALVAFLVTLREGNQAPAADASRDLTRAAQPQAQASPSASSGPAQAH